MRNYFVYIVTNRPYGVLYVGVTNNLARRIYEHKHNLVKGFSSKYRLYNLVYFDETTDIYEAITHEKRLKRWRRN